jgi:hypothetical protein
MSSRFGNSEGFKAIHLTDKNGARSNGSVSSPPWLGHFTRDWDAAPPRKTLLVEPNLGKRWAPQAFRPNRDFRNS